LLYALALDPHLQKMAELEAYSRLVLEARRA